MSLTHPDEPRSRDALLAHVRHELRTPLNAILGYSEMLLEDAAADREDLVPDLRRIHDAGKTLLSLVNELLDPARDITEVDLTQLSSSVRHALRTPLNHVLGYAEMLLEELAGEGDPFAPELERIRGAAHKLLDLLDGLGDTPETEGRSADGLAAASFASLIDDVAGTRSDARARALPQTGSILVVDDNESNRHLLGRRLERYGCTVSFAENGLEALELVRLREFDLILLDVMMPGLNGYHVLQRLKADESLRHIPVIMLSAMDELESVVRCIGLGAEDYLSKPFDPVLLQARIGACLEKKRLRDREVDYLRQIEEEKRRADELLHVILPQPIVEELKTTNAVKPRLYENVAVLFCDVVGFTPYCENREPEEVIAHLQRLVELYEGLALRHGLQKIKTIGDSFMASAGLLTPAENPALESVRCGLEMLQMPLELPCSWKVRVGIHVGPAMAGVVGHRQYLFDLWGDTVNTAARVESHGAEGCVNVSEAAWAMVREHCCGASLGLIQVKGKGEMELFRVDGLRA